jgi:hypothetical protein
MPTKSIYKRWTGTAWVEYYFKTSADLVDETETLKIMTASEREAISTYLTSGFNVADKLVKINSDDSETLQDPGKIDRSLIGDLSETYLLKNNPAFIGTLTGNTIKSIAESNLSLYGGLTSEGLGGTQIILADDTIEFNLGNSEDLFSSFSYEKGEDELIPGIINLKSQNYLTGLISPVGTSDATTKQYVDTLVAAGLRWATNGPVKAATSVNQASLSGLAIIDGYQTVEGDRILIYGQTTPSENGVYTVSSDIWIKDTVDSKLGIMVFVENGTTHNDWTFQATTDTTWISAARIDTILAGAGLTKTGTTLSISNSGVTNAMLAGNIALSKLANFASLDNADGSYNSWTELTSASTSENIDIKLKNLYAAIGLARGTANYNTDNTQTIAGAYTGIANIVNGTTNLVDSTITNSAITLRPLTINAITGTTADLQSWRIDNSVQAYIDRFARFGVASVINTSSANNARIDLNTFGIVIRRDIADANPTLRINNNNLSNTANIVDFQFGGVNKLEITKDGFLTQNGTRLLHNFKHPTGSTAIPNGQNIFVGELAGNFTMGSTATSVNHASYNTAIGYQSFLSNTTGSSNVAVGWYGLFGNTTGSNNSAVGLASGRSNTSGSNNTFIGYVAGFNVSQLASANNSTAIGNGSYTTKSNQMVFGNGDVSEILLSRNSAVKVGIGLVDPVEALDVFGNVEATRFISTQTTGTAPLTVASTTKVDNLNADYLDGQHGSYYSSVEYVNEIAQGLKSAPAVEVATTASLTANYLNGSDGVGATLTSTTNGAFPEIDGYTLTSTTPGLNGVLVKNQANPAHNGRYNLTQQGTGSLPWILTRCAFCDQASEIPGSYVFVKHGTLYANTGWVANVADQSTFVVGTNAINYFQFSGAGTYTATDGVKLEGTVFSADTTVVRTSGDQTLSGVKTFTSIPAFNGGTSGATAPFTVDSTQVVTNLNADLLDGQHGSYYAPLANATLVDATVTNSSVGVRPLTINGISGTTARLQEWQVNNTPIAFLQSNGIFSALEFFGNGLKASAGGNNSFVNTTTNGTVISRNIADSNPSLVVNQANAFSTGDILRLQFAGANKLEITKDGFINQNGTRLFHQTGGTSNTFFGNQSGNLTLTGTANTGFGDRALLSLTSGGSNVAVGFNSLNALTTGITNVGLGLRSFNSLSTGNANVGIGTESGRTITTGSNNTFVGSGAGFDALQLATATNSTALGNSAYTDKSNQMVFGNSSVSEFVFNRNTSATALLPRLSLSVASATATREKLMDATISDDANSRFVIANGTITDGVFAPSFGGISSSTIHWGLKFTGFSTPANDASNSSNFGLVDFEVIRTDNANDPFNGTISNVANRKAFTFRNGLSNLMTIMPDGKVGIGTSSPAQLLTVVSQSNTDGIQVRRNSSSANQIALLGFRVAESDSATNTGEIRNTRTNRAVSGDSDLSFHTFTNTALAERMRIRDDGLVGINETSPTAQLQVKSGATTRVPLVVDTLASGHTTNLAEFNGNNSLRVLIASDGLIRTTNGISNMNSAEFSRIFTATTGTTISRNVADTNPALIVNLANASASADIVKFQKAGTELTTIDNLGRLRTNLGLANLSGAVNGVVYTLTTGVKVERNVADSNTALIVNQQNASSTGNILDLQASGTNVISFKRDGTLLAPTTFTIDPSGHGDITGKVIILGDLQVDGTTTTINSTTIDVADKNIVLSKGAINKAASDGAGITIDLGTDGSASLTYGATADAFTFNKDVFVEASNFTVRGIYPRIDITDTDHDSDFSIINDNGRLNIYDNTLGLNRMTFASNGNIGIGYSSPQAPLHILNGDGIISRYIRGDSFNSGTAGAIRLNASNTTTDQYIAFGTNLSGGPVNFTERMRMTTDGNFGIGTSTPSGKLHISSGTSGSAIVIIEADTDNNNETDLPELWFKADGGGTEAAVRLNDNELQIISNVSTGGGISFLTGTETVTGTNDPGTNAIERMTITNTGNIGIGTTSPSYKLDVRGSASGRVVLGNFTNDTNADQTEVALRLSHTIGDACDVSLVSKREGANAGADFYIEVSENSTGNNVERFRVRENGNIGIGTSNPQRILEIQNATASESYLRISGSTGNVANVNYAGIEFFNNDASSDGPNVAALIEARTINSFGVGADLVFGTTSSVSGVEGSRAADRMIIKSDGKVGIGTNTPGNLLDVNGSSNFRGTMTFGSAGERGLISWDSDNLIVRGQGNMGLVLGTNGVERLRINTSGNVGIGTTSPANKFHIHSTGTNSNMSFTTAVSGETANDGLIVGHQDDSNIFWGKENVPTRFATNNSERMRITSDGNVGIGTTSPGKTLDVAGEVRSISTAAKVWAETSGTSQASLELKNSEGHFRFITDNGTYTIYDQTDMVERLRIDTEGRIGIGTAGPVELLDVNGNARIRGNIIGFGDLYLNNDNTPGNADTYIYFGDDESDTAHFIRFGDSEQEFVLSNNLEVPSITIDNLSTQDTATLTTTATTQTALATFAAATYGSGKFLIQATQGTARQITELLVVHDGTTVYATEYAIIQTGSTLFTTEVDISGGNVRVLITPASATSTTFKTTFTLIGA